MFNVFSVAKSKSHSATKSHITNITLADKMVPMIINHRQNAKRITLRVGDDQIKVTAPVYVSQHDIMAFVDSKSDWINARLEAYADVYNNTMPSIIYHGIETAVRITPDYHGHRYYLRYYDNCLWLDRPLKARMSIVRQMEKHLKAEADTHIRQFLTPVLAQLNEAPVSIIIRDQKSRWGSCSTSRKLSFSWRLVMAPLEVMRYVVIHEAAHLKHHNHSQQFWSLVHTLMPEYQQHRNWLKQHQKQVMAKLDRRLAGLDARPDDQSPD